MEGQQLQHRVWVPSSSRTLQHTLTYSAPSTSLLMAPRPKRSTNGNLPPVDTVRKRITPLTKKRRSMINFFTRQTLGNEYLLGYPRSYRWILLLMKFIGVEKVDEECILTWLNREASLANAPSSQPSISTSDKSCKDPFIHEEYPQKWYPKFRQLSTEAMSSNVSTKQHAALTFKYGEGIGLVKEATGMDLSQHMNDTTLRRVIPKLAFRTEPWMADLLTDSDSQDEMRDGQNSQNGLPNLQFSRHRIANSHSQDGEATLQHFRHRLMNSHSQDGMTSEHHFRHRMVNSHSQDGMSNLQQFRRRMENSQDGMSTLNHFQHQGDNSQHCQDSQHFQSPIVSAQHSQDGMAVLQHFQCIQNPQHLQDGISSSRHSQDHEGMDTDDKGVMALNLKTHDKVRPNSLPIYNFSKPVPATSFRQLKSPTAMLSNSKGHGMEPAYDNSPVSQSVNTNNIRRMSGGRVDSCSTGVSVSHSSSLINAVDGKVQIPLTKALPTMARLKSKMNLFKSPTGSPESMMSPVGHMSPPLGQISFPPGERISFPLRSTSSSQIGQFGQIGQSGQFPSNPTGKSEQIPSNPVAQLEQILSPPIVQMEQISYPTGGQMTYPLMQIPATLGKMTYPIDRNSSLRRIKPAARLIKTHDKLSKPLRQIRSSEEKVAPPATQGKSPLEQIRSLVELIESPVGHINFTQGNFKLIPGQCGNIIRQTIPHTDQTEYPGKKNSPKVRKESAVEAVKSPKGHDNPSAEGIPRMQNKYSIAGISTPGISTPVISAMQNKSSTFGITGMQNKSATKGIAGMTNKISAEAMKTACGPNKSSSAAIKSAGGQNKSSTIPIKSAALFNKSSVEATKPKGTQNKSVTNALKSPEVQTTYFGEKLQSAGLQNISSAQTMKCSDMQNKSSEAMISSGGRNKSSAAKIKSAAGQNRTSAEAARYSSVQGQSSDIAMKSAVGQNKTSSEAIKSSEWKNKPSVKETPLDAQRKYPMNTNKPADKLMTLLQQLIHPDMRTKSPAEPKQSSTEQTSPSKSGSRAIPIVELPGNLNLTILTGPLNPRSHWCSIANASEIGQGTEAARRVSMQRSITAQRPEIPLMDPNSTHVQNARIRLDVLRHTVGDNAAALDIISLMENKMDDMKEEILKLTSDIGTSSKNK